MNLRVALPRYNVVVTALAMAAVAGLGVEAHGESTPPPAGSAPVAKPVNLSRLMGGATVQLINAQMHTAAPVSGLTAAIDDDPSSGWAPPVGKSALLLTFAQDADVNSITLFAPGAKGSYSISVAPSLEAAMDPAGRKPALTSSLGNNSSQSIANVRSRYMVVELDVTESALIRSIDVVGRPTSPAGKVSVVAPKDGEENTGKEKGQLAEVNFAADSLGAKVENDKTGGLQPLIDGDTGTTTALAPANGKPATVSIQLAAAINVDRLSLAFEAAEGTVSFLASDSDSADSRLLGEVKLDGKGKTLTIETGGINADAITIKWQPASGDAPLVVSEVGVFAIARVVRTAPEPDGSSNVSVQPVVTPKGTPPPPPSTPPGKPKDVPPPILPPPAQVSA